MEKTKQDRSGQNLISGLDFHYKFNYSQIYPQMVDYERQKKEKVERKLEQEKRKEHKR